MNQNTVLITGANSQIGREIVKVFLDKGWRVHATVRSRRKSKELVIHENVVYHEMDLERPRSVEKTIQKITRHGGKLDVLINNAGFVLAGAFETYSQEQVKRQMDVNFFGALHSIRAVLPTMKKAQDGCIVNISSLCGLVCFPLFSMYHASKWAMEGFSESIKYELEPLGIRVKLIEPGGVKDDRYSSKVEFGEQAASSYDAIFDAVHKNPSWFPGFCSSAQVAAVAYQAATDKQSTLRYPVGEESSVFLQERIEGFKDESFIDKMKNRIFKNRK